MTSAFSVFDFSLLGATDYTANDFYYDEDGNIFNFTKYLFEDGQLLNAQDGLSMLVSCSTCASKCGNDFWNYTSAEEEGEQGGEQAEDENAVVTSEIIAEWTAQLGECVEMQSTMDQGGEIPLFAGWMCNADGTMVEPMIFLDDSCTVYNSMTSFAKVAAYEQAMYYTDDYAILQESEAYIQSLFTKSFPLFATPTPISWPDALEMAQQIAENSMQMQTDELVEQYMEEMANADENEQQQDEQNADEETYEDMWWEALMESLGMESDNELVELAMNAIDLETCMGTYGQATYEDGNGNEVYYNASSFVIAGEGGEDDLTGPCSIIYWLNQNAQDASAVHVSTNASYYAPVENTGSNKDSESKVSVKNFSKSLKLDWQDILIITASVVFFVYICLMIIKRTWYKNYKLQQLKEIEEKKKPLIAETEANETATSA